MSVGFFLSCPRIPFWETRRRLAISSPGSVPCRSCHREVAAIPCGVWASLIVPGAWNLGPMCSGPGCDAPEHVHIMRSLKYTCAILGLCLPALCQAATTGLVSFEAGVAALPTCARTCVETAIAQSTCPPTNADCLCTNDKFNNAATECIQSSCTIKESLAAKNITSRTCGVTPTSDGSLIPLYSIFIGLAVIAVILRLVARVLTQAYFWWDDFSNLFGFIGSAAYTGVTIYSIQHGHSTDIWFVSFGNITLVLQIFFVQMILYTMTHFFVRASIIFFYMRIFPPQSDSKLGRILQLTMVFNVVYNLSFLLAVVFQCSPVSHFWTQWEGEDSGHCGNSTILVWVAAITGVAFDLWLLALPFPPLFALNLSMRKKVMGGIMFFVGAAIMIISLVRLKTIGPFSHSTNPTQAIAQLCLWSGLELDVGVICPCLPSFRLLLRQLMPAVMGTSNQHEMDRVSNPSGNTSSARRKSRVGGLELGSGNILVENTIAIKYGSNESADGRSCASVTGLVERGASTEADENRWGNGGGRGY
ncbi:hypothetical protein BT67DRAFT_228426 [Trichocladium antarcticum]|uniref:CFEM domain-containing protein n=1 Tax=Trichocladium antarcticum TaxID=1450529 RepID=A0AAN6ZFH3_9PEZI|nr:hypothetical protein BT67DRAFT_228426 [Trichocladium antarcticum]